MLIWINGAFGAGKTSVATELKSRLPESIIYDPEIIGTALGYMVPKSETGDYQDLPIWRDLVATTAIALRRHYDKTLIVPMAVVNAEYLREIVSPLEADADSGAGELQVLSLIVSAAELRRRITEQTISDDPDVDAQARQWRLDQVERCVGALADEDLGRHVSNEGRPVAATVDEILSLLQL